MTRLFFTLRFSLSLLFAYCLLVGAQQHSQAQTYKQLPPAGIEIKSAARQQLASRVKDLSVRGDLLAKSVGEAQQWLPDVQVLIRAVDLALRLDGFYRERQVADANSLLDEAERRLEAVAKGFRGIELLGFDPNKIDSPQTLIGGYRSRIDDSVQPYGIVLPTAFTINAPMSSRMDVWLHGRGDTQTEIAFLTERRTKVGQYAPKDTIVLHPFGRHCNAFKFAGETDVYEVMQHVSQIVDIDSRKIAIRGFSMGGAGCWHLAVHDPGRWFAANPGAGFVDTLVYQGWVDSTPFPMTPTREKLLNWYDVLPWVGNLRHRSTIAYSGEIDKQRQAADRVIQQAGKMDIQLDYVVGEKMGHKIDAASAQTIDRMLEEHASDTNNTRRSHIDFTTYTLRYSKADWFEITGLEEHWRPGRVQAKVSDEDQITITTSGITRLKIDLTKVPREGTNTEFTVTIDGEPIEFQMNTNLGKLMVEFHRADRWKQVDPSNSPLRKQPGLQGPIDDAFCDRFLFVMPSQPAANEAIQKWIEKEIEYAKHRWQTLMRGEVRVVMDKDLTESMIENNHLICFGDFSSNLYLKTIQSSLPFQWNEVDLSVQSDTFDSQNHVLVMCYPNPKNQQKYLVINSGMTFREFSNVSNSRQIAMLPDWAILRTDQQDDGIFAGKVVRDGFFDETWQPAR